MLLICFSQVTILHNDENFVLQDGQIDYEEFAAMMRKGNGGIGRRTMRNTINLGDALGLMKNGSK